jgi:hypothetical protein
VSREPESRPALHDFVCVSCLGVAGRIVSCSDQFLYLRCDDCGAWSVMPNRRTPLPAGESKYRRVTDPPHP